MINYIFLVLLLLASTVLLKCTSFPLVIPFVNFVWLFHLYGILITIMPFFFMIFFPLLPDDYSCKYIFYFTLLVFQTNNANLSCNFLVSYNVTGLFTNIPFHEIINIAISLIFNHNPNLNITKKELKKLFIFPS